MAVNGKERRRVLFGTLLIALLLATATVIFLLDEIVRSVEGRTTIVALLPDAPGVSPGTPVWIAGERVGEVRSVEFLLDAATENQRVALDLEIPERLRPQIVQGTVARITSSSLAGEPVIDLVLPAAAEAGVADTVVGRLGPGREELMARAGVVRARFDSLAAAAATLTEGSAWTGGSTARLQQRIDALLLEVDAIRIAGEDGSIGRLMRDPLLRARIDALSATASRIGAALDTARTDRSAQVAELRGAFAELSARADSLSTAFARLQRDGEGTLGRFAADSALSVAIRGLQMRIDSLIAEAGRDPLRFVF